jgi:hypothetical protein
MLFSSCLGCGMERLKHLLLTYYEDGATMPNFPNPLLQRLFYYFLSVFFHIPEKNSINQHPPTGISTVLRGSGQQLAQRLV